MSALACFREELRALLGPAFLRRDSGMRALFVSDAPRRLPDAAAVRQRITDLGYTVTEEAGLWRIDLAPARRIRWISSLRPAPLPSDIALRSLCRSLLAGGEAPPEAQPWPILRETLLLLDAGEPAALRRLLTGRIAVLKRQRLPLPTAAASLIENYIMKEAAYADLPSRPQ